MLPVQSMANAKSSTVESWEATFGLSTSWNWMLPRLSAISMCLTSDSSQTFQPGRFSRCVKAARLYMSALHNRRHGAEISGLVPAPSLAHYQNEIHIGDGKQPAESVMLWPSRTFCRFPVEYFTILILKNRDLRTCRYVWTLSLTLFICDLSMDGNFNFMWYVTSLPL